MMNKVEAAPKEPEVRANEAKTKDECRHHWIIESANGPASMGVCKICGEIKEFSNSPPEFMFSSRRTSDDAKLTDSREDETDAKEKTPASKPLSK